MLKKMITSSLRHPWKGLALVTFCGILVGILTLIGQATLPGSFGQLANSGAVWVVPAFFLCILMPTDLYAAIAGFGVLIGELTGFYVAQAVVGIALSFMPILLWVIIALIAGPLFGIAGRWWFNAQRPLRKAIASAMLASVFIAEGLEILLVLHYLPEGWGGLIIGILIPLLLGRTLKERLQTFLSIPVIALIGLTFYLLGNALFSWILLS